MVGMGVPQPAWLGTVKEGVAAKRGAIAGSIAALVCVRWAWKARNLWVPRVEVARPKELDGKEGTERAKRKGAKESAKAAVPCYDPATMEGLGEARAYEEEEVEECLRRAEEAHKEWRKSSWEQRRRLMRILQRWILENQRLICEVSSKDSGKAMVDSAFGEVMVTLEKIEWLCQEGEKALRPERRKPGKMMFYKRAWVEYVPVGVAGAIVPWNYPFHNVFNPLLANVFAGNALVIKCSEWASWSPAFYQAAIDEALRLAGAPARLVQLITGYGETGRALVASPRLGKITFVGSTEVGKKIMATASANVTPTVLELGGKDPLVICDDADLDHVVPVALRAAYQCNGQNCAGGERFIVEEGIYDEFVERVVAVAKQCRQGHPLSPSTDVGAMRMASAPHYIDQLVKDAEAKGARVRVGGYIPEGNGQFYAPTVVEGVTRGMRIAKEEVFGPVLAIFKVKGDEEAIEVANDCPYGLGANAFSRDKRRARRLCQRMEAGMAAVNDFATTYMAQSLPFGGVKESGFDRFAGPEGLRGCCHIKAYVEDGLPFARTDIPPPLRYPLKPHAFDFIEGLISLIYGVRPREKIRGLSGTLSSLLADLHPRPSRYR